MPKLTTPEGQVLDDAAVARTFAEAMAAPEPDEPMAPAPERNDEGQADEPAGRRQRARADDPAAEARHGRARTTASRAGQTRGGGRRQAKAEAAAGKSYAEPISEFLEALVITGALMPVPPGPLAVRIRLQAGLVSETSPGLVKAIDAGAQNNAVIRRGVESLTMGSAGWVLPAVLAVAPFAAQSLGLWRMPVDQDMASAANEFAARVHQKVMAQSQGEQTQAA